MKILKNFSDWLKNKVLNWLFPAEDFVEYEGFDEDEREVDDEDDDNKNKLTPEQIELMKKFVGSIQITVLSDGNIFVSCNFASDDDIIAETYGKFLYAVNNGVLAKHMLDYLVDFGGQDIKLAQFVTKIINGWKKADDAVNDKPVICPTQTFKLNRSQELLEE